MTEKSNEKKESALAKAASKISLSVIGAMPKGEINCYAGGLPVRFNCQTGNITNSQQKALGNKLSINIIKLDRFFGDLGMSQDKEWIQMYFIPTRECDFLPQDTVCFSYIKTVSSQRLKELMIQTAATIGADPCEGIFDVEFIQEKGQYGSYYSIDFKWRERDKDDEFDQLIKIADFLNKMPRLEDFDGTKDMIRVSDLSEEEYRKLLEEARERRISAAQ